METKKEAKHEAPAKQEAVKQAAPSGVSTTKPQEKARIGVFICHCGTNIAGSMDIEAVGEYAKTIPNVAYVDNYKYMCSMPGQAVINKAIKDNKLNGVVVAACSPRLHEPTFRTATKEGGLNQFRFEMANIREQNSWVHMHDQEGSTEKAKDAIRIAVAKAALLQDLFPKAVPVEHAAMVVGAGVAGMQAALDLANAGIKTYLIESQPTIGGRMSQLDKTFPTLDCSQCILTPKMVDVGRAANIELMTYSEVDAVEGYIGNFDVTIRKKARGVLTPAEAEARGIVGGGCNGCGDCEPVCPVVKPNEFEVGMKPRKAIYISHPQVVPLIYTIDWDSCIKCGLCVTACGPEKKAIDLEAKDELVKVKVGTAILATGYDMFPVEKKTEWGYKKYENVISSLEFERLICASGPTSGHLVRPSDGETPKRVAFVLCAGSRDNTGNGKPYCSRFCCMYSLKHAHQIYEKIPGVQAYLFYMDIRSFGKMYRGVLLPYPGRGCEVYPRACCQHTRGPGHQEPPCPHRRYFAEPPGRYGSGSCCPCSGGTAERRYQQDPQVIRCILFDGWMAPGSPPEAEPLRDNNCRCIPCRCLPGSQGYSRYSRICRRCSFCGKYSHPQR